MRVLVVGSGGREHALVWKIHQSPLCDAVYAAPGGPGMAREATLLPEVKAGDAAAVVAAAREHAIDLVVIGPEDPLAAGLADELRAAGFAVFGPSAAAARLEGSKRFAREFMARHGIPQPAFDSFRELAPALDAARARGRCVVKADGLAAGKGVTVCDDAGEAEAALVEIMKGRRFGAAGDEVLVEERVEGEEASYYAICDGEQWVTLSAAQDHKRALDGDRGENTGGMGAYTPAPVVTAEVEKRICEEIVAPTFRGLREEGMPFVGVLFVGLMIDASGAPKVIEYNVRFGDPETQALLLQLRGDLLPILDGAARGKLDPAQVPAAEDAAVCIVLASKGYPRNAETGFEIKGIDAAESSDDVVVFHSGTKRDGDRLLTAGGRVLGVTARGADVAEARARAYAAADQIHFEGRQLRRDIADRALDRTPR